jgi:hypothetical protein
MASSLTPDPRYGNLTPNTTADLEADVAALEAADVALDARIDILEIVRKRGKAVSFTGTRTAAGFADVDSTNGKVTLLTTGGDLLAVFVGYCSNTNAPIVQAVALRLDAGSDVNAVSPYSYAGLATYPVPFATGEIFTGVSGTPSVPASHTVYARHSNNSATGTMTTTGHLFVVELSPP